jgi:hypothetical protein
MGRNGLATEYNRKLFLLKKGINGQPSQQETIPLWNTVKWFSTSLIHGNHHSNDDGAWVELATPRCHRLSW